MHQTDDAELRKNYMDKFEEAGLLHLPKVVACLCAPDGDFTEQGLT